MSGVLTGRGEAEDEIDMRDGVSRHATQGILSSPGQSLGKKKIIHGMGGKRREIIVMFEWGETRWDEGHNRGWNRKEGDTKGQSPRSHRWEGQGERTGVAEEGTKINWAAEKQETG
ncbi:hypothetical protein B0H13DRAFT_1857291 [Mycena leptocephala]|nr:hypothetical protein B0H13DRAFT_1857291 [Mycena leptocephala]